MTPKPIFICALLSASVGVCCRARSQEAQPSGAELADALTKVEGDGNTWFRSGPTLALCMEMGIPEERFRETHPKAKLDEYPAAVLAILRRGAAGIPAWVSCFNDERETKLAENDLFGGGSSPHAKKLKCGDVAADVVFALSPATKLPNRGRGAGASKEKLASAAAEWEAQVRDITPEARTNALLDGASPDQRRLILAMVIQMRHAPAYPLFEANFLERAKTPDDFLYLELSAYVRHRRAGAKNLVEQIIPVLRAQPQGNEGRDERDFFFSEWKLLTSYDSLQPAIDDWLAGKLESKDLNEVFVRSVDEPWAYQHGLGTWIGVSADDGTELEDAGGRGSS